jgi:hypothetical protein
MEAVAKSYMKKDFLIYEGKKMSNYLTIYSMMRPLVIYDFATAPFSVSCSCSHLAKNDRFTRTLLDIGSFHYHSFIFKIFQGIFPLLSILANSTYFLKNKLQKYAKAGRQLYNGRVRNRFSLRFPGSFLFKLGLIAVN